MKRGTGIELVLTGLIILAFNFFFAFGESKSDMGKMLVNSLVKSELSKDITVLMVASAASWVLPLFFIFLGMAIVKRSRRDEKDFF